MTEEMEEKQVNEIRVFNSDQFGEVRTVTIDDEPWFVAADVCRALEIGNSRMATERLDDDEKGVSLIDTPGGQQELTIINEPGLYSLVLGSRKPEAKAFKRWITHEITQASPSAQKPRQQRGKQKPKPSWKATEKRTTDTRKRN